VPVRMLLGRCTPSWARTGRAESTLSKMLVVHPDYRRLSSKPSVPVRMPLGRCTRSVGKNGSGKSTLSKVLVGHPDYEVTGGSVGSQGR